MTIAISIGIFLSIILFVEGAYYCYHQYLNPQNRNIKRRLRGGAARPQDGQAGSQSVDILRQRKLSDLPWLHTLLASMSNLGGLEKLSSKPIVRCPLEFFCCCLGCLVESVWSRRGSWIIHW